MALSLRQRVMPLSGKPLCAAIVVLLLTLSAARAAIGGYGYGQRKRPFQSGRTGGSTGYLIGLHSYGIHHCVPMLFIATAGSRSRPLTSKSLCNRLPNFRGTIGDQRRFSL